MELNTFALIPKRLKRLSDLAISGHVDAKFLQLFMIKMKNYD